jgi:hypothetical protein
MGLLQKDMGFSDQFHRQDTIFNCESQKSFRKILIGGIHFCQGLTVLDSLMTPRGLLFTSIQTPVALVLGAFSIKEDLQTGKSNTDRCLLMNAFFEVLSHDSTVPLDINIFEVRAVRRSVELWGHLFSHQRLLVFTENMATYNGITKGTLNSSANDDLRSLLCTAPELDILIQPQWIAGKTNELADAISRFDLKSIANWCPHWQIMSSWDFPPPPQEWLAELDQSLSHEVKLNIWNGLTQGTRASYSTARKSFEYFCANRGQNQAFPVHRLHIIELVSLRAKGSIEHLQSRLSAETIENYVSALRSIHVDRALDLSVFEGPTFRRVLVSLYVIST